MMVIIQDWLINPLSPLISKAFFFFLWVICSVLDCPAQRRPVSLEKTKKPNPTSCQLSLHPLLCFISSALRPPSFWVIASVTSALTHFLPSTFGPFAAVGPSNVTAANATVNPGASSEKQLHLLATESRCCVTGRVSLRWRSAAFLFSLFSLELVVSFDPQAAELAPALQTDGVIDVKEAIQGAIQGENGEVVQIVSSVATWTPRRLWDRPEAPDGGSIQHVRLVGTLHRVGQAIPSGSCFCLFVFVVIFNFRRILIKTTEKYCFLFFPFSRFS